MMKPDKQMQLILRGAAEVIQEEELLKKLQRAHAQDKPLVVKTGFDPTAPDIHLGHTVLIEKMRHFQELGHNVVFLIGDFTGMIGDPSGKNEMRPPLTPGQVQENAATYREQIFKILSPEKTRIVFNSEWLDKLSPAQMITLMSRYTVARMLEREDFKNRYASGTPICIHEFLYPLVQGYDSVAIKADVELGGMDQKFNLLIARDLQREYGQEPQCIVLMPLLEGLDGVKKMSKSLGNYIGITEPATEMFGKIMSISDELMLRYYELLSHLSIKELALLKDSLKNGGVHPKAAKEALGTEIVQRYWGPDEAAHALSEFGRVFGQHELPKDIPVVKLAWDGTELWVAEIMKRVGLVGSTSEAVRLVKQSGVKLDGKTLTDPKAALPPGQYLIQVGKRRFLRVEPEGND